LTQDCQHTSYISAVFLNDRRVLDGGHRVLHLQLCKLSLLSLDALLQVFDRNILDFCTFHLVVSLDCGFDVVTPYDKLGGNGQFLGTQAERFLRHFNLDFTYYNTKTQDQTFEPNISTGSGSSKLTIQSGNVRNRGFEVALGYSNTWGKFSWDSNYTLSANKNKILSLADDVVNPETGEHFHEQFYEYTYDLDTIRAALEKHGFVLEKVCDGESFGPLTEESERYFFCAVKQYTQLEEKENV